jgi:hypothetical protein
MLDVQNSRGAVLPDLVLAHASACIFAINSILPIAGLNRRYLCVSPCVDY